ncbi:glycosyltransferase family 4 protein [Calorimonas adulescens]|uniref:Glycosyltransferase family 4 protein n=1 Tax=Calorimonas adulescens TaxID=2606906 RepID=A0A5D8QF07_9THEO|nr:glycosyltransferase family 4 protein [Calorimonas adulescens]TZE83082.1 glycosyltransferase family 4 protein [Calorimonas adulescens]
MKIVHICQYFAEDMGYQENLLPVYQKILGHKVYIITSDREPLFHNNKDKRIVGKLIKNYKGVELFRINIKYESINRFVIFNDLYNLLENIQPDYIFHHGITVPSLFTAIKYVKKNPYVILNCDIHSDYNNSMRNYFSEIYHKVIWRNIIKFCLPYIKKIYCVAPESLKFAENVYKIYKDKLEFLPLGGDTKVLENYDMVRSKYRKLLGINDNELLFVHAGKITSSKNTKLLLESFNHLEFNNIHLLIIGDIENSYYKELEPYIVVNKRIKYIGWKSSEELEKYFCAADLLIQPGSLSAIFEQAICCGLPVVLKECELNKFLVSNNNGILLKQMTSEELENILRTVIENRDLIDVMHKKAVEFAQNSLSYQVIANKTLGS